MTDEEKKLADAQKLADEQKAQEQKLKDEQKAEEERLKNEIKVVDGKTYTADEVKQIALDSLKKGANITKNQLHNEITSAKTKLAEINTAKADLEKKLADATAGSTEAEAYKKQISDLSNELTTTKGKLTVMENEGASAIEQVTQLKADIAQKELNAYKNALIADAKGEIISEMVMGNTTAELDASAKLAKEKYASIQKEIRVKANLPEEKKIEQEENPIVIPTLNFAKPDMKEWANKKQEITNAIYKKHGFPVE